jgi:polysaccharide export outer membrane protein
VRRELKTTPKCAAALFAIMTWTALAQSSPSTNSLLISAGDNLHITVQDMPEMEQYGRVTDAGDVPVQGVGNVRVANMTPGEAATAIHDRFVSSHFLNHPQVSVVVDQYATQEVTLIGEVRTPGAYPIATPRPILDVLALGGGLNDVADRSVLVERHGDQTNPIRYNVSNDGEQAIKEQVLVNPGDTVVVARAGIIYVLGDVNRPGGYTMSNNESKMSLLEALANAGGAAKTARLSHVRLIRKSDHTETQIALGDIEKGKQPDFAMSPGDILFVPFSYAKNLVISSSGGIASAAGTAAVYAGH